MKLIHFPQELLTLLIAFTVSTCAFANNHEETDPDWNWVHDFVVDNYAYDIIPSSSNSIPCVVLIEAHGHSGHIDIPAYVTHNDTTYQVSTLGVGGPVFRECRDLTSVYIPKEIMMINNNPFVGCSNLANISVDPENKYYDSRSLCHALVTSPQNPYKEPNMLVAACKNTTIPNDVEVIGTEAFYQCHYLTQINIPNSVTTIKRSAFNGCERLSTLVIGEGVRTIEGYAFFKCAALKTVMCLAETPPFLDNCVFKNTPVDALDEVYEIALQLPVYVPDQSVDMYKSKWPWSNFNIQPLSKANSLAYKSQWCDSWTTFFKDEEANTAEKTWLYRLGQDTIINQHTYTIVNRYSTMQGAKARKEYVAAVRFTDDKKVYIFYDNTEYLLYDFNVQEGDKIEVFAGINNYSEQNKTFRCVVHEVNMDPNT
ncbi:MAG: leucine-rich repeat domain-containing protein, partial [Paludibacteraceae bacterium]|nr:leucine-rich repeat domain-containing protein [Paludibacteraceae bacterium]